MELVDEANAPAAPAASPGMPLRADHNHTVFATNKPAAQMPLSNEHIDPHFEAQQPPSAAENCGPARSGAGSAGHGDCARTAASIIEQLDPNRKPACRAPPTEFGTNSKITTACQRLLTILVCPCSEQPGVALLVASACIALMDAVLHQQQHLHTPSPHHQQQQTPDEVSSAFPWPPMPTSPHHHHARSLPMSASLNDYYSEQGEFDGLAKIAKVVLRFTQRYVQDEVGGGGGATRALVDPIVMLLRSKLQFVTGEATGRVVL
jgi:hypothetical protein